METTKEEVNTNANSLNEVGLIVGIQYRYAGKIYNFKTDDPTLKRDEWVVVESEHGTSLGIVIVAPREILKEKFPKDIKKILRRAEPKELEEEVVAHEKALELFEIFKEKALEYNLPMKPLTADMMEGGKKVMLTFYAEERVDFRALVKELAARFKMRVEMRQVGSRDEVKYMGGIGSCGRTTCCCQHLRQFQSISIQMAKVQGLMPNPAKLTGSCGKLKCCLAYENGLYAEMRKHLPRMGAIVGTKQGEGKVVGLDILREICVIRLDEERQIKIPVSEVVFKEKAG